MRLRCYQRLIRLGMLLCALTWTDLLLAQTVPPSPTPAVATAAATAAPENDFPYLPDESQNRALSIGDTSHGRLVAGRAVRLSESLGILPRQRKRQLQFGSEELIEALEKAGRDLHKKTGRKLWLGNVARQRGGDIRWSVSHNSGRDADIAFCYADRKGKPVVPPDLVRLNGHGLARGRGWRLDVAATWTVIESLLSNRRIQVQYLFVSGPLRNLLLTHARTQGAPASVVTKAAIVLRQPAASSPHNDHLHLRVYCSEQDTLAGCINTGAVHPGTREFPTAKRRFTARVVEHSQAPEAEVRRNALRRLVLLRARSEVRAVKARLRDSATSVRLAAADAMGALAQGEDLEALIDAYRQEQEDPVRLAQIRAIGRLGGQEAGTFLRSELGRPDHNIDGWWHALRRQARTRGSAWLVWGLEAATSLLQERAALFSTPVAARLIARQQQRRTHRMALIAAAQRALRLEPVPRLIGLLSDPSGSVRDAAATALREITNLNYFVRWTRDSNAKRNKGVLRWRRAWRRGKGAVRDAWVLTGFQGAGYKIKRLDRSYSWELVRAIHDGRHLSRNAQRLLMRLHKHESRSLSWGRRDACQYWLRFVKRRRRRLKLPNDDGSVQRACNRAPSDDAR